MSEDTKCPQCGEPLTDHTFFGRVFGSVELWHLFSPFERPSEVE